MLAMVIRRFGESLISLALLMTFVFVLAQITPGGPAYTILGAKATPQAVEALREELGLNLPVWQQYLTWWSRTLQGELGYSHIHQLPVAEVLQTYFLNTLVLYVGAFVFAVLISLVIGMLQAHFDGRWPARLIGASQLTVYSLPTFLIAMLLIVAFSVQLEWFPAGGVSDIREPGFVLTDRLHHMALPLITLVLAYTAFMSRYFGQSARVEYRQDYVLTALSRGVPPGRIATRHVLRNALRPLVTVIGIALPYIFVGGVLVESVFDYPGVGFLLWQSALNQDYPVVTDIVLIIGLLTIAGNLLADVVNSIIDVRVRYE